MVVNQSKGTTKQTQTIEYYGKSMFRTVVCRSMPPFALFLRRCKGKFLGHATIAKRGKALGKAYHAMPPADKASLIAKAKSMKTPKKRAKVLKRRLISSRARCLAEADGNSRGRPVYRAFVWEHRALTLPGIMAKWQTADATKARLAEAARAERLSTATGEQRSTATASQGR